MPGDCTKGRMGWIARIGRIGRMGRMGRMERQSKEKGGTILPVPPLLPFLLT